MITVGISTRNRLESLARCVKSLSLMSDIVSEVIVVDDCSDVPIESPLRETLGKDFPLTLSVIRQEENAGYIVARNLIVVTASSDFIMHMDDDAFIIEPDAVRRALAVITADEEVGAIAFAQANEDGSRWPESMQPASAKHACYIPSFIGFAHLLRRNTFRELGGYREIFFFYGEEKEFCLRMLDAGYRVVYLPDALVAHVPDPAGRNMSKYLRYTVRNNCLGAMYNEPFLLMVPGVAARLLLYFRMRRGWSVHDPRGFSWILKELLSSFTAVWSARKPLRLSTLREWRKMRGSIEPYAIAERPASA